MIFPLISFYLIVLDIKDGPESILLAIDKTAIIQNAQKFAAKGQIDKAIEEWQKLAKDSPNDGNIYNSIGDLYLKKNKNAEAVAAFSKAGVAFEKAGFALKTIAVYKKIIKLEPDNQDIHIKLADLDAERGLVGNAIEEYLKVIRQYTQKGFIKDSIVIYKKIVALDPNNVMVRNKLIDLLTKEGDKKGAAEQYVHLGVALKNQNKVLEGEEALRRALAIDPNQSQAQALLKDFRSSPATAPIQAQVSASGPAPSDFSGPVEFSLDDS
ncbi:MAG TPA: tetratricopeptide repeat protein, partial [Nitrospiria bacterium]|nr:tetratricopeptide repeat protein [Nitrospiria bacterium]